MEIVDIIYYALIYTMLFYTLFYFLTLFENKKEFSKDPKAKYLPSITIAIPAYNEEKYIEKCVRSVLNQNYPEDKLKVIVVDDGSTDKTVEIVRSLEKENKRVKLIMKEHGGYKAAAVNKGLENADTELFGFIDADSYIESNSIANMVGYFENEKTGSVIGNVLVSKPKNLLQRLQYIEYLIFSLSKRIFHFIGANYVAPAFAIFRTDTLKKLGGLEKYNPSEDVEIGLRLLNKGYKIQSSYNSIVHTESPKSIKSLTKQRIRWNRGFFHNTMKYSNTILNRNFGDLGLFVLPMNYITMILINIFMLTVIISLYGSIATQLTQLYAIGFDFTHFLRAGLNLSDILNMRNLFLAASAVVTLIFVSFAKRIVKNKQNKGLDYIIFLFLWPFITNIILIISIIQHLRRAKYGW